MNSVRFSRRLPWTAGINRLTQAVADHRASGRALLDLTVSNPTRVALDLPAVPWGEILGRAARPEAEQQALGLWSAREAVAGFLSRPGDPVDPADLVLTASTSEAYSYLFKLFADPGDSVLTAVPSYPLLESLTALDGVELAQVRLEYGQRWDLDPGAVAAALGPRTRLLALVHPANPTGSFLLESELDRVVALCAERSLPLLVDEVFSAYPLAAPSTRAGAAAAQSDVLAFSLGGLSKSVGLPGWKLGWIRVGGPRAERRRAIAALELVADTYLSVATPVQGALAEILRHAPAVEHAIRGRLQANLAHLRAATRAPSAIRLLAPEGGWTAVLRVPRWGDDEETVLRLLGEAEVLVHPGFFYDFASEGYVVVSLLPELRIFSAGIDRLVAAFDAMPSALLGA